MDQLRYFHEKSGRVEGCTVPAFGDRDFAFFCPCCGTLWARAGLLVPGRRWQLIVRGCTVAHARDMIDHPGSLMINQWPGVLWPMPRAFLLRELDLAVQGAGFAFPLSARYNTISRTYEAPEMSPELSSRIAELRTKAMADTITDDELKEALTLLREDRKFSAAKAGAAKRSDRAAASAPVDTDALLKSFF